MEVGDKIMVLDDVFSGIVVQVNGEIISVETDDGFEMDFNRSELVIISSEIKKNEFHPFNLNEIKADKQQNKPKKSTRVKPKERSLPPMEVDLHIHQLVPNEKGMSNFDMLEIQLDTAKRQLEFAMRKKIQRIVFIHGVGEGVLKTELEFLFRKYDNVAYNDANYQKYGRGATEVYIFQNIKNN
ncbi:MAG: Smr/MutS family protein [Patiriisocius sp.]|uniref:Smr/MutS family protein n=1 Tax=Patiriisocius sp. TaxID=2822396 RepID=UPI003EF0BBBC